MSTIWGWGWGFEIKREDAAHSEGTENNNVKYTWRWNKQHSCKKEPKQAFAHATAPLCLKDTHAKEKLSTVHWGHWGQFCSCATIMSSACTHHHQLSFLDDSFYCFKYL